ncbi:hypothetical protein BDY19DRAFT_895986 [Irpex rosettiformis]|uniref:Uncharacterized protein n=1 Tax=Irpex rosettiformis TaxID=378272 RepID=A0ACB8TUW7_9APHY|nr:hypothetical protein BDY19DRAFT_895986 [Irpex rosettiformis]
MAFDELGMHRLGLAFVYRIVPVIVVSVLYGIYIAILCSATFALIQRGLRAQGSPFVLISLWLLFLVSTALWGLELAQLLGLNQILLAPNGLQPDALFDRFYNLIASETKITGVLFECQMIIGDIIVIWRASAIWHDRRTVILLPLSWWALMIINMIVHASLCQSGVATTRYGEICKATDVLAPTLSIMVNVSVMLLTIYKAWLLRDLLRLNLYEKRRDNKVLSLFVLLIESGTLYVTALVTDLLVTSYVTGGNETIQRMISCISGYSTVQFVGIYPTLMIVMLRRSVWNRSGDSTVVVLDGSRVGDGFSVTVSEVRFASPHDREKGTQLSQHQTSHSSLN